MDAMMRGRDASGQRESLPSAIRILMASLAQLQTFLAVYRTASLTRAAAQLHLSQPSVSAHLRALETELSHPLFLRHARGVSPTPRGDLLARDVAPHLDALQAVQQRLRAPSGEATVQLGGPADLLSARAVPALAALAAGGIHIRTRTGIAEPLVAALAADELDLVLASRQVRAKGIHHEPLFDEELVLIASPAWARRLQQVDPSTLEAVPLVAFDDDLPLMRRYWREVFGVRLRRVPAISLADLRGVCAAVAAGAGISVVPRYVAAPLIASGELITPHPPAKPPTNHLSLAYRPAALHRPGVSEVHATLLRAAPGWQS
jgi:DNA-binding transcriptional LysR family regulator